MDKVVKARMDVMMAKKARGDGDEEEEGRCEEVEGAEEGHCVWEFWRGDMIEIEFGDGSERLLG